MNKLLILILSLATIFACAIDTDTTPETTVPPVTSDDSVKDDLAWFDVVEQLFYYPDDPNQPNGSYIAIKVDLEDSNSPQEYLPFVEQDDANNLVGAEVGVVNEANKLHVNAYYFSLKAGYHIKLSKGQSMSEDTFENVIHSIGAGDGIMHGSNFYSIGFGSSQEAASVAVGSEWAILEVYDNAECTGEPLEVFKLVL